MEVLLTHTSAKADMLERVLEKTWIAHVIVAGIGFAMVFNVGHVLQAIVDRYLPGASDLKTVTAIMMAIYLYYFMRTGPLLTAFNEAKALQIKLWKDYLKGQPEEGMVDSLHGTTSFLAEAFFDDAAGPVYAVHVFWRRYAVKAWVPYFFITALVVSLAQAAVLFLVNKAFHASAMFSLVLAFLLVSMFILYFMFWKAPGGEQNDHTRRSLAVIVLLVLVILWLVSFDTLAPSTLD